MTDQTQKQSTANNAGDTDSFAKLWQEKWAEMLKQQGWPDSMTLPGFGTMPFTMPFMSPFGGMASDHTALLARIAELETRLAALEKSMAQRTTKARKNTQG